MLEWKTGFEPAAFSLATRRATSCATSTSETHAFRRGAPSLARHGAAIEDPCMGGGAPGLTVPRAARAAGWSPTTVEPPSGVEPETFSLPRKRSATELWRHHPKVGESPKPDSNRRPSAYKADALAGLSYQGVVVVILERGHSVEHAPGTPPAKTTATRAINSAQWDSRCCPGRIRTSTDLIQNQESCR